jgi:hypothetical protein
LFSLHDAVNKEENKFDFKDLILIDFRCLSAIFSNIMATSFSGGRSRECPERTTDNGQATGKLDHLRLRVEGTLFLIYKAGREPIPYW